MWMIHLLSLSFFLFLTNSINTACSVQKEEMRELTKDCAKKLKNKTSYQENKKERPTASSSTLFF